MLAERRSNRDQLRIHMIGHSRHIQMIVPPILYDTVDQYDSSYRYSNVILSLDVHPTDCASRRSICRWVSIHRWPAGLRLIPRSPDPASCSSHLPLARTFPGGAKDAGRAPDVAAARPAMTLNCCSFLSARVRGNLRLRIARGRTPAPAKARRPSPRCTGRPHLRLRPQHRSAVSPRESRTEGWRGEPRRASRLRDTL